jgi:hypothetical protein
MKYEMSDIEAAAEFNRNKHFYERTLANIEQKLDERFQTLCRQYVYDSSIGEVYNRYLRNIVSQENDPEMKELRNLRDEISNWFFTVLDYYRRRDVPESDQEWRRQSLDFLYSPRYYAVMAWAMRRRPK